MRQRIAKTQAQIDNIQEEQGTNFEREAELLSLKQKKKNFEKDLDNTRKESAPLERQVKNKKAQEKVDWLRASLAAKESERNALEEKLNDTKALDDLKEQDSELPRQNKEDQTIIQSENSSSSEKEAAEARLRCRQKRGARAFGNSDHGKRKGVASVR